MLCLGCALSFPLAACLMISRPFGVWFADVGEWVDMDEVVLTLETDKVLLQPSRCAHDPNPMLTNGSLLLEQVSFDVRAPEAGYVEELLIEDGDTVPVGAVLLKLKKGDPPAGAGTPGPSPMLQTLPLLTSRYTIFLSLSLC